MSEVFSGKPGRFVELNETIEGFQSLLGGEGDAYPEAGFYMVGNLKEAYNQAKRISQE